MFASILTQLTLAAAATKEIPLALHDCDFGESYSFTTAACTARLTNHGDKPLSVSVRSLQPGDSVSRAEFDVPASGNVDIQLKSAIGNQVGRATHFYAVSRAGTGDIEYLKATGFAMSALSAPRPHVNFGSVSTKAATSRELTLGSADGPGFRINRILDKPKQVDVTIAPDGVTLRVVIRPDADWGLVNGAIKLSIESPRQKEAWVRVDADIHGDVEATVNPASIGILSANREQSIPITMLKRSDGASFRVGRIDIQGIAASADIIDCTPASSGCKWLRLLISDKQGEGLVRGKVLVELPDAKRQLPINVDGYFLDPQHPGAIDPEANGPDKDVAPAQESDKSTLIPEPQLNSTAPDANVAPPPGTGPLLKWNIADERSVYGYQVFRSDKEAGPYLLLNSPVIPAASTTKEGSAYQWRDNSATKGTTYWYYVGVVYADGGKDAITAHLRATAK